MALAVERCCSFCVAPFLAARKKEEIDGNSSGSGGSGGSGGSRNNEYRLATQSSGVLEEESEEKTTEITFTTQQQEGSAGGRRYEEIELQEIVHPQSSASSSSPSSPSSSSSSSQLSSSSSSSSPSGLSASDHLLAEVEPVSTSMGPPAVCILNLMKDYHASSSSSTMEAAAVLWGKFCHAVANVFSKVWTKASGEQQELPMENRHADQPYIAPSAQPSTPRSARAKKRRRPAVNGLSLDLWAGQVTCLLGHNGAGKVVSWPLQTVLYYYT
jgi:ABC-type glutathione transport system ATPase component